MPPRLSAGRTRNAFLEFGRRAALSGRACCGASDLGCFHTRAAPWGSVKCRVMSFHGDGQGCQADWGFRSPPTLSLGPSPLQCRAWPLPEAPKHLAAHPGSWQIWPALGRSGAHDARGRAPMRQPNTNVALTRAPPAALWLRRRGHPARATTQATFRAE